MDWLFIWDVLRQLSPGVPLTLKLAALSLAIGFCLAVVIAAAVSSRFRVFRWVAKFHVELFRGTPLLVQIFLIYYGLGQIPELRHSFLWPYLREPYWCAIFALALNTSAYTSEIIRGSIQAVPKGEIETAQASGMSGFLLRRRIIWPIAVRQGLPVYGSEIILTIKATSLASIITLAEVTGIAYRLTSDTYRITEIFVVAGGIYLLMNFFVSLLIAQIERRLNAHHAHR